MSDDTIIEVAGLSIRRGVTILEDINWRVRRGEHWVILGANGSGKTSLLSALNAYLAPSSGNITVAGRTYGRFDWRELRKEIGMVSSSIRQKINDGETALEVVASGQDAVINHWGELTEEQVAKASTILEQVECAYLIDRPWQYLSQGERQRVLIGRALMADLSLLILDEPCAGLDPVAREKFLRFMDRFAVSGAEPSVILVTHHVEEIVDSFSHVLLLYKGRVLDQGEKRKMMTSANMSTVFNANIEVEQHAGRYSLKMDRGQFV